MKYANVSVKFPRELDGEIERFLEETRVYTNKSEFIKEACRSHLQKLNDEPAITALRLEKLLEKAEANDRDDVEIKRRLERLGDKVDEEELEKTLQETHESLSDSVNE